MSVKVDQIVKLYGEQFAVDHVSFEAGKGSILGFLGPNGAGKSTTMKMLSCFISPSSGTASICGHDILKEPMQVRNKLGYLPENNPLYPDMYVREYLSFVARLYRLKKAKSRIAEMMELTGLNPEAGKKIGQLSKGYRQRVGLAQAMLNDPEVLILDEPTSGLDPNQLKEIRELIRNIGQEKTVILSTHIMQEVQAICNRVVIINHGKIVADDTTDHLRNAGAVDSVIVVKFKEDCQKELLSGIKGIEKVEKAEGRAWRLTASGKGDLQERIFRFAIDNKLTLIELQREQQSLEDIFSKLTVEKPAHLKANKGD